MIDSMGNFYYGDDELYHFGVLGMKWGVRRYQNKDGSLTPAGYRHLYGKYGMSYNGGRRKRRSGLINRAANLAKRASNYNRDDMEYDMYNHGYTDRQKAYAKEAGESLASAAISALSLLGAGRAGGMNSAAANRAYGDLSNMKNVYDILSGKRGREARAAEKRQKLKEKAQSLVDSDRRESARKYIDYSQMLDGYFRQAEKNSNALGNLLERSDDLDANDVYRIRKEYDRKYNAKKVAGIRNSYDIARGIGGIRNDVRNNLEDYVPQVSIAEGNRMYTERMKKGKKRYKQGKTLF